jgi:DNA-binding MarR family transcriptional regulator
MKRKASARPGTPKRTSTLAPAPHPVLSPAFGVVDPLSELLRWARVRLHDRIMTDTGIPIDRSAVVILDTLHHDGPMRMSMLAATIGLDRSTVSRQVAAVVAAGLVEKTDDVKDARAAVLSLSARGQSVRQAVAHSWQAIAMELIDDWRVDEQVEFGRLLSKLAHRLREEVSPQD